MATSVQAARLFFSVFLPALLSPLFSYGQKIFSLEITGDYRDATMIEMFIDLEKHYPIRFYYDPAILPYYKVGYDCKGRNLYNLLQTLLPQHNLTCVAARENGIVICRKADMNANYITALLKKWDENRIELPEFLTPLELERQTGTPPASNAASVTVEGLVNDDQSKEPVPGAVIRVDSAGGGAATDRLGKFKLSLPPGEHLLTVGFIGYRDARIRLQAYQSGEIEIPMQVRALELVAVEIQGNRAANKQTAVATGVELLSTQTIKDLPSFMGESDVIKSLLVLPGVSTVGEGSSGFNVRGGNVDQNLVIQDELPFFNTSHVLGFFSVFNPDLVRSTTLYKGHIPAQFGGRVASVLDVKLRDGNFSEWQGSAGAGLASGKVSVEGPILKNKLSILAGARSSYSDWMLKLAKLPDVKSSSAWFNDLNAKISLRSGKNGTLSAGAHRSEDYFRFAQQFGYRWKTTGADFSWRQTWGNAVVTSLTGAAGKLQNAYFQPEGSDAFELNNGLEFRTAHAQVSLLSFTRHEIQAGAQWNRNNSLPQSLRPNGDSGVLPRETQQENGEELAFYAGDEFKISEKIGLYAGLRYSAFRTRGPNTVLLYEPDVPYSEETVADTLFFGKNEVSQTYGGFEPRVSLNIRLDGQHAVKFSYNRLRQYMHLISNTTAATPTDTWQPANRYLRPQVSDSYNAGWFFTKDDKRWETSLEFFYRNTEDVPAYKDFAELLLNEHLETELIAGRQRSYGAECLYRKNEGRWTGWLSYTWSRVWQRAESPYPALSVNRGDWFPSGFDQPNQVTLFAKYAINPALYWTFNFTYRTGRPVTAPVNGYQVGNVLVPNFSDRNNLRIPDYHRLDIGFTIDKTKSKLTGLKWTLNLSVYNAYGRKNPFSVYFKRDRKGLPKAYQLAVIGSVIPAANLSFYW